MCHVPHIPLDLPCPRHNAQWTFLYNKKYSSREVKMVSGLLVSRIVCGVVDAVFVDEWWLSVFL